MRLISAGPAHPTYTHTHIHAHILSYILEFVWSLLEVICRYVCVPEPVRVYGIDRRFDLIEDAVVRVRGVCAPLADVIQQCTAEKAKRRLDSCALVQACTGVRDWLF